MKCINVEIIQPKLRESGFEVGCSGSALTDLQYSVFSVSILEEPCCKLKSSTAIQGDASAISELCFRRVGLDNRLVIFSGTH